MLSLKFNNAYIKSYNAITSNNEKNGNISNVKSIGNDYYYGAKTFDMAQEKMMKSVIDNLLKNDKVDLIIGGDLTNQLETFYISTNNRNISSLGLYSACSTFIESVINASILTDKYKKIRNILCITSSHNLVSEKEFRYPVEYGALRDPNSTYTATCAIGAIITNQKTNIKINSATIGSPVEYGIKDPNYIGAIMAPAAGDALYSHLINNNKSLNDFDLILTGDLGNVGLNILKDYLKEKYNIYSNNIKDAGSNLYKDIDEINDGASGPAVLPLYFFYNILNHKKYKHILLIGTGSLHSKTIVNQKNIVPAISHIIEIEVI